MIKTEGLKEGDVVIVSLAADESEEITGKAKCRFSNGIFVNIEKNVHRGEIYGSSVVRFKKVVKKRKKPQTKTHQKLY